jgi:hypothetical protein
LLQEALRQNGLVLEEYPNLINIRALSEVKTTRLQVVGAEESLAAIEDKTRIVDKVFVVSHYDVQKAKDVVLPMLPNSGHLMADSSSRTLIVTDTVGNLNASSRC